MTSSMFSPLSPEGFSPYSVSGPILWITTAAVKRSKKHIEETNVATMRKLALA